MNLSILGYRTKIAEQGSYSRPLVVSGICMLIHRQAVATIPGKHQLCLGQDDRALRPHQNRAKILQLSLAGKQPHRLAAATVDRSFPCTRQSIGS